MKIVIDFLNSEQMRYSTCGDYFYDKEGVKHFQIIDTGNEYYNTLILLHEMTEEIISKNQGIIEQDILAHDIWHEKEFNEGRTEIYEPGEHPLSPYADSHFFAETIERLIANKLKIDWNEYDKSLKL